MDHQDTVAPEPEVVKEPSERLNQLPKDTARSDSNDAETGSRDISHIDEITPAEPCETCDIPSQKLANRRPSASVSVTPDNAPVKGAESEPRLALRESLGTTGLLIILGGAILILASVAFLPSFGSVLGPLLKFEVHLGFGDASPYAATSAVCTSMIAALILERSSVAKSKVARFSIARTTNNGPLDIVSLILSPRNLKSIAIVESSLLFLLLFETTGLQFSSTILLADIHDSAVVSNKAIIQLNTFDSISQQNTTVQTKLYRILQPSYAVFGEWPSSNTKAPQRSGLSETGIVSRAFLPLIQPEERIATRFYEGGATLLNLNTACVRPEITNFNFRTWRWPIPEKLSSWGQLNATLDYDLSIRNAKANESCGLQNCSAIPFSCDIAGAYDGSGWQTTMCFLGGVGGTLWPYIEGPRTAKIDIPWSVNSSIYLVLASNMRQADWLSAKEAGVLTNETGFSPVISDYEEWRSYQLLTGRLLNVSLCFQAYNLVFSSVQMEARASLMEPSINYNRSSGDTETGDIQRYFGADPKLTAPEQRGILTIGQKFDRIAKADDGNQELTMRQLGERIYSELALSPYTNASIVTCYHCSSGESIDLHPDLYAIIANIFNSTSRAVDMVQTYVASIATTIYYDSLKKFTVPENVTLSSVQTVQTAHGCRSQDGCAGFISVVTLLGVHLVVILTVTIRYVARTRYSRYSNVWSAIAQVDPREIQDVADDCTCSRDRDVERTMKQAGSDELVRIGRIPDSQRVGVLKYQKPCAKRQGRTMAQKHKVSGRETRAMLPPDYWNLAL
ncbi:hypothetical protein F4777DRAFT_597173 [Nemania sp. FL0916]|nr:hypothetical protein F4777DRAFT_597173 [Nemania sp. FL0916]